MKNYDCSVTFNSVCQSIKKSLTVGYKCREMKIIVKLYLFCTLEYLVIYNIRNIEMKVFHFFVKSYHKSFEQFLHSRNIFYDMKRAFFFTLLANSHTRFKFESTSTLLSFHFQYRELPPRAPLMWRFFYWHDFLWETLVFLVTGPFLIYVDKFVPTRFLCLHI